jgi:hypothetical protein
MIRVGANNANVCYEKMYNGSCKVGEDKCKYSHDESGFRVFKDTVNQHFFRINGKELDLASQAGAEKVAEFLETVKKNNQGGNRQGGGRPQQDRGRRNFGN